MASVRTIQLRTGNSAQLRRRARRVRARGTGGIAGASSSRELGSCDGSLIFLKVSVVDAGGKRLLSDRRRRPAAAAAVFDKNRERDFRIVRRRKADHPRVNKLVFFSRFTNRAIPRRLRI